jgi:hypothetical protein
MQSASVVSNGTKVGEDETEVLRAFYRSDSRVAVGTTIADGPRHRFVRAALPHTAPTLDE